MISINIDGINKNYVNTSNDWICQQIRNRQRENLYLCVSVSIRSKGVDILLSVGNCPASHPAHRKARQHENELFDLWESIGLKEKYLDPEKLVKFLNKISHYK